MCSTNFCLTTWVVVVVVALPSLTEATQCQPIDIDMCKSMPYNMTTMPNLLHHSTQRNANLAIEQYQELVDTGCSDVLLFFLCSVYAPICNTHFRQAAIPPCRHVCRRAREGCEPTMQKYNVPWPSQLDCKKFPLFERGVCISPNAIVAGPSQGGPDQQVTSSSLTTKIFIDAIPKDCPCQKPVNTIQKKTYYEKNFHYAVKATFISAEGLIRGPLIITIYVSEVLKKTHIPIPSDANLTLWVDSGCICPKLETGKEYLILGFQQESRLLFDDNSLALPWKNKWMHRIKSWDGKKSGKGKGNRRKKPKTTTTIPTTTTTPATTTTTTSPTTTTTTTTPPTSSTTSLKPTRRTRVKPNNRRKNRRRKADRAQERDGGNRRVRHQGDTLPKEADKQKDPSRTRSSRRRSRKQPT